MPRPLRPETPNGFYHVTAHGLMVLFADDEERRLLLRLLDRTVVHHRWRCLSYCLMGNHLHLLLRTPEANLSAGMQQLKGAFATSFNRRRGRRGHVFDGRYGSRLLQRESHLLECFRYIANNPVKDGFCGAPCDWSWSAHGALCGHRRAPRWLSVEEALGYFADGPVEAGRAAYRRFVEQCEGSDP